MELKELLVMEAYNMRFPTRILPLLIVVIVGTSLLPKIPIKQVSGQVGDFLMSVSPTRVTVGNDGIGRYSIRITSIDGFVGTVKLDVTGVNSQGARTSFTFQPSVIQLGVDSDVYSVLTILGMYETYSYGYQYWYANLLTVDFKITASGGGISKITPASADIIYGPSGTTDRTDVTVNVQPNQIVTSGDITQGKTQTLTIAIATRTTSSTTSGELLFTTTPQFFDPPSGLYISFNPTSVDIRAGQTTQCTATILMTPEFLEKSGTYRFAIGVSGLISGTLFSSYSYQDVFVTKTAIVTIVIPPFFNVAIRPSILDVYIGGEDQKLQIVVTPVSRGLSQAITLRAEGIPAEIVASFESDTLVPKGKETLTTNLRLNAPSQATPGVFPIRIYASTMGITRITNASINLRPSGDYSIKIDQTIVSLNARGESRSVTLTITPQGDFKSTVKLTVANVPHGVTASLSSTTTSLQANSPANVILTLTATSEAQPGTYDITLVVDTGFSSKTVNLTLLIRSGTVEIWPVVLVVVILIAVISAIVFIGMPRGRQVRVVPGTRRMPVRVA